MKSHDQMKVSVTFCVIWGTLTLSSEAQKTIIQIVTGTGLGWKASSYKQKVSKQVVYDLRSKEIYKGPLFRPVVSVYLFVSSTTWTFTRYISYKIVSSITCTVVICTLANRKIINETGLNHRSWFSTLNRNSSFTVVNNPVHKHKQCYIQCLADAFPCIRTKSTFSCTLCVLIDT